MQRSFADANNSPAGPKKAQFEERLANWDTRLATPTAHAIGRFSVPSTDARTAEAAGSKGRVGTAFDADWRRTSNVSGFESRLPAMILRHANDRVTRKHYIKPPTPEAIAACDAPVREFFIAPKAGFAPQSIRNRAGHHNGEMGTVRPQERRNCI